MDPVLGDILKVLAIALFLAELTNRLVAVFLTPFFEKMSWDKWWIMPISWIIGGVLSALAGLNLFVNIFPTSLVGLICTAIAVGGGSNLLHDLVDRG